MSPFRFVHHSAKGDKLRSDSGISYCVRMERLRVGVAMFHKMRRWLNVLLLPAVVFAAEPISLHPGNPHYFRFRGKPAVLITSGEHYGAVLNRAFDFGKYLDTLAADNLNLTRVFAGGSLRCLGMRNRGC
jgi:hypothetical protein